MTADRIIELANEWQHRLGLDGWVTKFEVGPMNNGSAAAEVWRSNLYEHATIHFHDCLVTGELPEDWENVCDLDDFYVEQTIVHELLHCVMRDFSEADKLIETKLSLDERHMYELCRTRAEEVTVDKLATALVRAWSE